MHLGNKLELETFKILDIRSTFNITLDDRSNMETFVTERNFKESCGSKVKRTQSRTRNKGEKMPPW